MERSIEGWRGVEPGDELDGRMGLGVAEVREFAPGKAVGADQRESGRGDLLVVCCCLVRERGTGGFRGSWLGGSSCGEWVCWLCWC